jgi:hypothetical protein
VVHGRVGGKGIVPVGRKRNSGNGESQPCKKGNVDLIQAIRKLDSQLQLKPARPDRQLGVRLHAPARVPVYQAEPHSDARLPLPNLAPRFP